MEKDFNINEYYKTRKLVNLDGYLYKIVNYLGTVMEMCDVGQRAGGMKESAEYILSHSQKIIDLIETKEKVILNEKEWYDITRSNHKYKNWDCDLNKRIFVLFKPLKELRGKAYRGELNADKINQDMMIETISQGSYFNEKAINYDLFYKIFEAFYE